MAVSFDHSITWLSYQDAQDRLKFVNYQSWAYTASAVAKQATFDYFSDTSVVGDMLYIGWIWSAWHNLTLTIDTPLVATAIDIIWEYPDENGIWQPLTVIDNTNMFQNSWTNTVEFDPPSNWQYRKINSPLISPTYHYGSFIRARIVSVSWLTEWGANWTTAPTALDFTIQITNWTFTLDDVYDYDVANWLGLVTKIWTNYQFDCNFRIWDSTTTNTNNTIFNMIEQSLIMWRNDLTTLNLSYYAHKYSLFAQSRYDTWNMWNSNWTWWCKFEYNVSKNVKTPYNYFRPICNWYNSLIQKNNQWYSEWGMIYWKKTFKNCIFSPYSVFFLIGIDAWSSFENCIIDINTNWYWYIYTGNFSFDNIQLTIGRWILAQTCTLSNTKFGSKEFYCYSGHNHMIDCQLNNMLAQVTWRWNWKWYIEYNTTINLVDKDWNSIIWNVEIKNSNGDVVYDWPTSTQVLLLVLYKEWVASILTIVNENNPFTFTITKDWYETYELKDIAIEEKTNRTIKATEAKSFMLDTNWKINLIAKPADWVRSRLIK